MSEADLARVRSDLDAMRRAAGLPPAVPQRAEVWCNWAAIPCGLFISLWAATRTAPAEVRLAVVPLIVLGAAWAAYAIKGRRAGQPEAKGYLREMGIMLLAGAAAWAYLKWQRGLGVPNHAVGVGAMLAFGVACGVVGTLVPYRRALLGAAAAAIAYGLVMPLLDWRQTVIAGGAAVALAGLLCGAFQTYQRRVAGETARAD